MTKSTEPLLTNDDALIVGQFINLAFESFKPEALTAEQGVVLFMLLDRMMTRLWDAHEPALRHLFMRRLIRMGLFEPQDMPE